MCWTVYHVVGRAAKMLDFENLSAYMDYLASSVILSPEQRAAVQSSLVILKHEMKFSHLCFWGRIHGTRSDYYVVQGVEGIDWYNRRTLFSQVRLLRRGFLYYTSAPRMLLRIASSSSSAA